MEFRQHKRDYYIRKLGYAQVTPSVLKEQVRPPGAVPVLNSALNFAAFATLRRARLLVKFFILLLPISCWGEGMSEETAESLLLN